MPDLDPAAVLAEHTRSEGKFPEGMEPGCTVCEWSDWPCLPYRLAEALAASEAEVARLSGGIERALAIATNIAIDHGSRAVAMKHELAALAGPDPAGAGWM